VVGGLQTRQAALSSSDSHSAARRGHQDAATHQLGPVVDKDSEWRATAIYSRAELEMLIVDPRVAVDHQVFYGLQGIGGLRNGEAAGLRWRHYKPEMKPLGQLVIATSYDKGRIKTGQTRLLLLPVHPTLAALLAEWKLHGWPEMMGRQPTPDDLMVPLPAGPRVALGTMRTKCHSYKRLRTDLKTLGLRHRCGHASSVSVGQGRGRVKLVVSGPSSVVSPQRLPASTSPWAARAPAGSSTSQR